VTVSDALAEILSGGDTDMVDILTEEDVLELEREAISRLARHEDSLARMEHMLVTGKPLRN
jgi:3-hydroxyacyl-CoA dehydrogenase